VADLLFDVNVGALDDVMTVMSVAHPSLGKHGDEARSLWARKALMH